jgi:hypothetical protein
MVKLSIAPTELPIIWRHFWKKKSPPEHGAFSSGLSPKKLFLLGL